MILVEELRSYLSHSQKKKNKKKKKNLKNRNNIIKNSIKNLKMVHFKKILRK